MRLYQTFSRIISLALVVTLLFTNNIQVFAGEVTPTESNPETVFDMGDTRIDYYETNNGDRVFLQYVNQMLTQKNTLPFGKADIVEREFFNTQQNNKATTKDTIRPSDFITVNESKDVLLPTPKTSLGTINYRALLDTGYTYYGLRCSYNAVDTISTYTIKSYVGTVVDLVSILVSATNIVASIGTTFIKRVCISAGIAIVGGSIKNALSTTVACTKTTYNWLLVDTTYSGHTKNVYGYKYHIIDSNYHTNENYFEGYQPSDWRTQALAVWLHNEMFAYSFWDVVNWS